MNNQGSQSRSVYKQYRLADLGTVALVLAVFFVWLGRIELLIPDEARHVEIAREMLANGSYLTPQLQGEPYYHKPVLHYWLVAASLAVFGHNETAARLPTVLAALLTVAAAVRFTARVLSPSVARLVALCLVSMPAFVALGRFGILDMTLTATLTVAFSSLGIWWSTRQSRPPYAFYVFIGAAMLVKGPVSLVQAAIAVACLLLLAHRDTTRCLTRTLADLAPIRGLLIALAIATPWYLAAAIADPDYIATFLFRHNMVRFLSAGPGAGHIEPWWYYPAVLPLLLLPWTPWVVAGLLRLRDRSQRSEGSTFCLVWVASVGGIYLPAASKIATYLLPALVPLACLAALAIEQSFGKLGTERTVIARSARRWALGFSSLVGAAAAVAIGYVLVEHPGLRTRLVFALPALLWLAWASLVMRSPQDPKPWVHVTAGAAICLLAATYGAAGDIVGKYKGMRSLAAVLTTELPSHTRLGSFRGAPHAATFYTGKLSSDLDSPEQMLEWLEADAPAAVMIRLRHLPYLADPLPDGIYQRWSNLGATVLLSNVAPKPHGNPPRKKREPRG